MKRILGAIDFRDVCGVVGFGCIVFGAYELHRDAGFIVAGVMLLALAVAAARK
jgi:hypothetical protein